MCRPIRYSGYEDTDRPWEPCTAQCSNSGSDHWSASLINARQPGLFTMSSGDGGFTMHPSVRILCSYPRDYGIGTYLNAHCGPFGSTGPAWAAEVYTGHTLAEAMTAQQDLGAGYNDVAVSFQWWVHHLPWAVEAFVVLDGTRLSHMRKIHADFLARFGLRAAEVPLLRFERNCHQEACWRPWDMRCDRVQYQCFVDVSDDG